MTGCFWQKEASFVVLSSKVRHAHVTPVASVKVVRLNDCHLFFSKLLSRRLNPKLDSFFSFVCYFLQFLLPNRLTKVSNLEGI